MAQLLQSQSMEDARALTRSIIVVALSESEGNDDRGLPVNSETCKTELKRRIAEGRVPIPSLDDELDVETNDPPHADTTELKNWVADICEEAKTLAESDVGDRDNLHFLPELVSNVMRMAGYLPLWTGVMVTL